MAEFSRNSPTIQDSAGVSGGCRNRGGDSSQGQALQVLVSHVASALSPVLRVGRTMMAKRFRVNRNHSLLRGMADVAMAIQS